MFTLRLIVPALPIAILAATHLVKTVAAVKQMKEVRKIREILEANLGSVTVKDQD